MFVQHLGQLTELYGEGAESFFANSNIQILPTNSQSTINWVYERLGSYKYEETKGRFIKQTTYSESRELMTRAEVTELLKLVPADELKKNKGKQILLPAESLPMKLKTVWFEKHVPKTRRNY